MPHSTPRLYSRREALAFTGQVLVAGALAPRLAFGAEPAAAAPAAGNPAGAVIGDVVAAKLGEKALADGGNAIDAAITAAFAAGIASPHNCGIGGYGGHATVAFAGKKVAAYDFDSVAPAAAKPDMFSLDASGRVVGNVNTHGWLAAGVPGTLAGLELILQRHGTRSLRDVLAPAIALCEEGRHALPIKGIDDAPRKDAVPGEDLPSEKRRNRALLATLKTLAARNTAESFYRGDLADKIAAAFQRNGGLVTRADLAAFRARELAPATLEWNGFTIHTAPLPSSGTLLLEAFAALRVLGFEKLSAPERLHAKLEALRIAWADRVKHFGDPEHVDVPLERLLSRAQAEESAAKIAAALKARQPVPLNVDPSRAGGTTHISAADRHGNVAAITLTHGGGHGARVAVEDLGVMLGHGMSRFDPRPGLPNSVGPRKRPMTNMCPSAVTRSGVPVLALGGAGGTRIPNSVYEVLLNYVGLGTTFDAAMHAPRIDANGTLAIGLQKKFTAEDVAFFEQRGYKVARVGAALVSAVEWDARTKTAKALSVGGA